MRFLFTLNPKNTTERSAAFYCLSFLVGSKIIDCSIESEKECEMTTTCPAEPGGDYQVTHVASGELLLASAPLIRMRIMYIIVLYRWQEILLSTKRCFPCAVVNNRDNYTAQ